MHLPWLLMSHVLFGVLGILLAVFVFVDLLNVSENNIRRIKSLSLLVALFTILAYVAGGYWYVAYYGPERDIIKAGPWPWAHTYFMEVKEHVFFAMLMLSIYLPVVVHKSIPLTAKDNRKLALVISGFIVLLGLAMEGAGAIISKGFVVSLSTTLLGR